MSAPERGTGPLQREIRLLVGALISFLVVLIVALLALTVSILRLNRRASTADSIAAAIRPAASTASADDLTSRLHHLATASGVSRIEVYRGTQLYASTGTGLTSAEVLTRPTPGGRVLIYFEVWSWAGGRRTALVTAAYVLIAAMAGVLIFILYVRQFLRPVEEMLDQARQLSENPRGDHDARYLVHTFRDAVEKIQQQSQEIDDLRDAASSRTPDVLELARALNTSFKSGFIALDAAGMVIAINDAGREILSLPEGPVHALSMLPESFATPVRSSIDEKTALTRREVLLESGTLVGLTTVPLFDDGAFVGLFALFTDLTTFRAMEGRLRDLEALVGLGQMAAGIAHEFRNSLFTILGYLKLAQRNGSPEQNAKIVSAETEARKLAAAVDALLTFTKPLQLHSRRFRLDEFTQTVIERFAADHPEVEFRAASDGEVEINGDPELLERALENVLRNAIDSVRERHPAGGGRIDAAVSALPHPTLIIRDNGVGIDPVLAASYLLPFQSGKSHGVGLGLPLARKIVLHHGGALSIEGALGEGALVKLEFFA